MAESNVTGSIVTEQTASGLNVDASIAMKPSSAHASFDDAPHGDTPAGLLHTNDATVAVSDDKSFTRDAFLSMNQVRFTYPGGDRPVVEGIDMALPTGAIHCLLGRSGCGKSTLLKLAAGLLHPDQGEIAVGGAPVREPDLKTGFVFQAPTLLAWLNVLDNVLLPVSLHGKPDANAIALAKALLAQLGLEDLQHRYPHQLSGGQQSRVAIARALLPAPRLLLMDEPFAALDALTRESLQDALLAVSAKQGVSVLFVTHDIAEAVYLGDRVAVVEAGRIACDLPVEIGRPRSGALRHGAAFNAVCAALRQVMEAGAQ